MKVNVKKHLGYSLIELMVIVVLIGIAGSVAVPSFREFISDSNLTTFNNDFVTAVALARTEAIRSNSNVSLQSANADWSAAGWNIVDVNNNVLRSYADKIDTTVTMTTDIGNPERLTFSRKGLLVAPANSVTVTICDDRTGESGRQLLINLTGRIDLNPNFNCP